MFKTVVIGNLTADPVNKNVEWTNKETGEIHKTNVCAFTVAANEGYGEYKQTQFFTVNAWRGLGDICSKYLAKGRQVYVEGPISQNNYVDKNNNLRSALEIRANVVEFLNDGKRIKATPEGEIEEPAEIEDEMLY